MPFRKFPRNAVFPERIDSIDGTIPRTNAHTLTHMFQFVPERRTEAVDDVLDATPAAYFRVQNTQSRHFHVCYVPGGEAILPLGPETEGLPVVTVDCEFSRRDQAVFS